LTRRVLFATTNPGKLAEARALLPACDVVSLADLGLRGEVEEDGKDYLANARKKALHWAPRAALPSLGEDSGLEVEALGGRPGVHSARYGGPGLDDPARNRLLLAELAGLPRERRRARFACALVLVDEAGRELAAAEGECRGHIAGAPRGGLGFGYDPIFVPEGLSVTFGEVARDEKSRLSHRGRSRSCARCWRGLPAARSRGRARSAALAPPFASQPARDCRFGIQAAADRSRAGEGRERRSPAGAHLLRPARGRRTDTGVVPGSWSTAP